MKQGDLIKIISKAFGLYAMIQAVSSLKDSIIYAASSTPDYGDPFLFLLYPVSTCLFYALAAFVLIVKSNWISRKLGEGSAEPFGLTLNKQSAIELVLIAITGSMILHAVPEILTICANYIYVDSVEKNEFWKSAPNRKDMYFAVLKLMFAFVLLINVGQISRRLIKSDEKDDHTESLDKVLEQDALS